MQPKKKFGDAAKTGLTVSGLRAYTGFEQFTDEQAEQAIDFINRMAKILFNLHQEDQTAGKSRP